MRQYCRNTHGPARAMTRFMKTPTLNDQVVAIASLSFRPRPVVVAPLFGARVARYHAGVSTPNTPRERAAHDAATLVAYLRTLPPSPIVSELVELGEHLERAVTAFHMEAIRFRAFTMSRLIKQHQAELPGEVAGRMEGILHELEAAGFQTKSVTA